MIETHSTYLMGANAAYDPKLLKLLREQTDLSSFSRPNWHWYRSNWRILHIDGFEPGFGFRTIHFDFGFSSASPRSSYVRFLEEQARVNAQHDAIVREMGNGMVEP